MPEAGQPVLFFFEYPIRIGCFRHTNLSQDSGKPRGGSGMCPWNPLTANHIAKSTNEKTATRYPKRVAALLSFLVWMLS